MFPFIVDENADPPVKMYESPSQFSREYSRHFGLPPSRDIKSLMQAAE